MNKNAAGGWNALEVMVLSFVVAAAAAAVLLTNFNGQGRLWDALSRRDDFGARAPMVSRYTPPDPGGSHILVAKVVSEPEPQAAAPVPAPAAAAPASAPAPAQTSWIKHITGSLNAVAISGPAEQHSSASASAAEAPAAPSAAAAPASASVASTRNTAAPAATAQPSYVNYGSNTRSDIMSSASGPVYNFAGKRR